MDPLRPGVPPAEGPWVREAPFRRRSFRVPRSASKLGAPHPVVAQQLLDALLLAACRHSRGRGADRIAPLKPDQARGGPRHGRNTPFLPGSRPGGPAKTQTLVGRIAFPPRQRGSIPPGSSVLNLLPIRPPASSSDRIASRHPRGRRPSTWNRDVSTASDSTSYVRFHETPGAAPPTLCSSLSGRNAVEILEERISPAQSDPLQEPLGSELVPCWKFCR